MVAAQVDHVAGQRFQRRAMVAAQVDHVAGQRFQRRAVVGYMARQCLQGAEHVT